MNEILTKVNDYYTKSIKKYGATSSGVDWKTKESQELRFSILLEIIKNRDVFSIGDLGCGYGALYHYILTKYRSFKYVGLDISTEMIEHANKSINSSNTCEYYVGNNFTVELDYIIASGIFNTKSGNDEKSWEGYILKTLEHMHQYSKLGFAFNCLSKYSDKHKMRDDLYYSDPLFLFDYCKTNFSKNIALLHDYGLYEFTILVRKSV